MNRLMAAFDSDGFLQNEITEERFSWTDSSRTGYDYTVLGILSRAYSLINAVFFYILLSLTCAFVVRTFVVSGTRSR